MVKNINPIMLTDGYKLSHPSMYPEDTTKLYSYFEARSGGKYPEVVFFGLSYFIQKYLLENRVTEDHVKEAKHFSKCYFGTDTIFDEKTWLDVVHLNDGIIPVKIWSVPEGTVLLSSNVLFAMQVEEPFVKLGNHLETLLSNVWAPCTVATNSYHSLLTFKKYAEMTSSPEFNPMFQEHDFGARGVSSPESAALCGAAHLLSFKGSDTIAAIKLLHDYYQANYEDIAYSVPASEHSVMTSLGRDGEPTIFKNLLQKFPKGILSVVIDSYDWKRFVNSYATMFATEILERDGKTVFRPDSGDYITVTLEVLEDLAKIFGYTINKKGYKVINPKVGVLWGDALDATKTYNLLNALERAKFSTENIVTGKGGGLLQKINRDDQRFAMKLSYREYKTNGITHSIDIMKNPIDSSKKSKAGRFHVIKERTMYKTVRESDTTSNDNILRLVYDNGKHLYIPTLEECRKNLIESHNSMILPTALVKQITL